MRILIHSYGWALENSQGFYNSQTGGSIDTTIITGIITDYAFNDSGVGYILAETAPVPEPATMLLFGTGLVGLVGARRRKKKQQ